MTHYRNHHRQFRQHFLIRSGDAEWPTWFARRTILDLLRNPDEPRACAGEYKGVFVEQLDPFARVQLVGNLLSFDGGAGFQAKLANQHLGPITARIDHKNLGHL